MPTDALSYAPLVVVNPVIPTGSGASGGNAGLAKQVPAHQQFSDQSIKGAIKVNPAYAADFVSGRYHASAVSAGDQEPLEIKSRVVGQAIATAASPNAWKDRPPGANAPSVQFGLTPSGGQEKMTPAPRPWAKKFIAPLALFNDASQWVNILMFNRPGDKWGNGNSDPPLQAQYFTPPPIETNNLAAGTLNAQLQLGTLAIQTQQLTITASNFFGGS